MQTQDQTTGVRGSSFPPSERELPGASAARTIRSSGLVRESPSRWAYRLAGAFALTATRGVVVAGVFLPAIVLALLAVAVAFPLLLVGGAVAGFLNDYGRSEGLVR